jgi:hypothetical protein
VGLLVQVSKKIGPFDPNLTATFSSTHILLPFPIRACRDLAVPNELSAPPPAFLPVLRCLACPSFLAQMPPRPTLRGRGEEEERRPAGEDTNRSRPPALSPPQLLLLRAGRFRIIHGSASACCAPPRRAAAAGVGRICSRGYGYRRLPGAPQVPRGSGRRCCWRQHQRPSRP